MTGIATRLPVPQLGDSFVPMSDIDLYTRRYIAFVHMEDTSVLLQMIKTRTRK